MSIKIALVGNPNCGKTTLFNNLTGSLQYVGNWPGVTVEKKEGRIKGHKGVIITDLPGVYSLSPYSPEEIVTRRYILDEKPDVIINIVDATNIERNLYLTTQITELGVPVIIALNMMDIIEKRGEIINFERLKEVTGCDVMALSALKGKGTKEILKAAIEKAKHKTTFKRVFEFSEKTQNAIDGISEIIKDKVSFEKLLFASVKLFERDFKTKIDLTDSEKNKINEIIIDAEKFFDDESDSIIINERYSYIEKVIKSCFIKKQEIKVTVSDKIDKFATHRFFAIPIFAIVMFLVYFIAVSSVGKIATDWTTETLFGKLIPNLFERGLDAVNAHSWLKSLIIGGILNGVGSVLGFLPQLAILFFLLAILEDIGYLSRIAFILDKVFRKFGLSGKSFIPMMLGTGCSIPGIMASRTIENPYDRKITVMTTSFIPCSAKLPIIALIAGSMFNDSALVAYSAYLIGILAVLVSGIILKKFKSFQGDESPFIMELPPYHLPGLKNILLHTWERVKAFIIKAGTIIFVAAVVIWFSSNFSWQFQMVEMENSILASVGKILQYLFVPLGFGDWKSAVATIMGLIAKENVVNAFGILYDVGELSETGSELWSLLPFTALSAYSFLVFNLLCAPCVAAIGAIKRELGSSKWMFITIGYQTLFAYIISIAIYRIGLIFSGEFSVYTVFAVLLAALFIYMILRKKKNNKLKVNDE